MDTRFEELIPPTEKVKGIVPPRLEWGKITSIDPLGVQMDGDSGPLLGSPATLVHPTTLTVGAKVLLGLYGGKLTIFGVGGGIPAGQVRPYLPLPEIQSNSSLTTKIVNQGSGVWSDISTDNIVTPNIPKKLLVRVDFFGIVSTTNVNTYAMLGVATTGATTLTTQQHNGPGGNLGAFGPFTPFNSPPLNGNADMSGWKIIELQPGVTTLKIQTMRNNTSNNPSVSYWGMTVTPIKWVDDTPWEPDANSGVGAPTGSYLEHDGINALDPFVWLPCDGRAVSRTTYAGLFQVIGTHNGAGDGTTTFNIPDRRGRVGVGLNPSDTEFNTLGKKFGTKTHTLTIPEMPNHNHTPQNQTGGAVGSNHITLANGISDQFGIRTSSTGGGGAHNNIQPSIAVNIYIKT